MSGQKRLGQSPAAQAVIHLIRQGKPWHGADAGLSAEDKVIVRKFVLAMTPGSVRDINTEIRRLPEGPERQKLEAEKTLVLETARELAAELKEATDGC